MTNIIKEDEEGQRSDKDIWRIGKYYDKNGAAPDWKAFTADEHNVYVLKKNLCIFLDYLQ